MADKNPLSSYKISEFMNITSMEREAAIKFLESVGWNYDLALDRFYEEQERNPQERGKKQRVQESSSPKGSSQSQSAARIVTMSSLKQKEGKKEKDEGQAFYAGGSTRSGQQVLGPSSSGRIVEEMFRAAKNHGAEVVEQNTSAGSSAHLRVFRGAGHVLGTSDINAGDDENPRTNIRLRAWRSGFTIDDGPLREYSDPQNHEFLTAVRKGEIPLELLRKTKWGEVSLDLEDHSEEEYAPPKLSLHAFSGQGHRLGSPTPSVACPARAGIQECREEAETYLNVNHALPVTVIQIRLADGRRVPLKLNHTHTIGQIRQFIVLAYPEYVATVFTLMTAYPPAELINDNDNVEDAKLLNSVIIQKLL